jgi:hypothetical protein
VAIASLHICFDLLHPEYLFQIPVLYSNARFSLCAKNRAVTSGCLGGHSGPVNRPFSKVRGSTPHCYHSPFLSSYSCCGTMPHHCANTSVPHLSTGDLHIIFLLFVLRN